MNGMQQSPFTSQGNVLVFQFGLNGTETANHNLLSDAAGLFRIFLVITAGSNKRILPIVRL
ncbi:hypothetical protein SDC9_181445 [bioreactor metagenome]|uniref:Uncharacterized protein n=1 Tax=bioreactor metagenome TaxID=1076179 RepID=A0A645HDU7_9ZZZZ